MAYRYTVLMGRGPDGKLKPVEVDSGGNIKIAGAAITALDIKLDGGVWVVQLKSLADAAIASVNIGTVAVSGAGAVAIPLDLVALGGSFATEIRVFGAGVLSLIHAEPANADFPVADLEVEDAEVIAQSIAKIHAIGAGITRLAISWGV